MSERVFDAFTRRATAAIARLASARPSRRDISSALIGVPLAGMWGSLFGDDAWANRKRKRRRKRRKRKNKKKKASSDCRANCAGRACGDNGCGGSCGTCSSSATCQDGACICPEGQYDCQGTCIPEAQCCTDANCDVGQICVQDQCMTGQGTCQSGDDVCLDFSLECGGGACRCFTSMANQTRCGLKENLSVCNRCTSDADCAVLFPDIPGAFCVQDTGDFCECGGACFAPCPN